MAEDANESGALRARRLTGMQSHAEAEPAAPEPDAPAEPVTLTDATFPEQAERHPLLVVDCWAPWCGPCRTVAPTVEALAREMQGQAVFGKLNVDEHPRTARQFGVSSIPTFLVFRNGDLVDRLTGALPKPRLTAAVRRHLGRGRTPGPRRL